MKTIFGFLAAIMLLHISNIRFSKACLSIIPLSAHPCRIARSARAIGCHVRHYFVREVQLSRVREKKCTF
jgi:hypothetical protein